MIYKIFTTIVFIAELIIAYAIVTKLYALDKAIINANELLISAKPSLRDICYIVKKISAQCVDFANDFVAELNKKCEDFAINQLNKILLALILLKMNSKFIKKLRRSKIVKRISRGLSLLQIVV